MKILTIRIPDDLWLDLERAQADALKKLPVALILAIQRAGYAAGNRSMRRAGRSEWNMDDLFSALTLKLRLLIANL